jgi:hypothetical protein
MPPISNELLRVGASMVKLTSTAILCQVSAHFAVARLLGVLHQSIQFFL